MEPTTLSGYLAEDKLMAAQREGVKTVILLAANARDVKPLRAAATRGLTNHYVSRFEEVAKLVFPSRFKGGSLAKRGRHHGRTGTVA
ncbi:MAG: hypothetical protein ISQ02_03940 [Pseudomonadales bacterium]|nr:hypothetical protein [Pseudomonadales bacterium]